MCFQCKIRAYKLLYLATLAIGRLILLSDDFSPISDRSELWFFGLEGFKPNRNIAFTISEKKIEASFFFRFCVRKHVFYVFLCDYVVKFSKLSLHNY